MAKLGHTFLSKLILTTARLAESCLPDVAWPRRSATGSYHTGANDALRVIKTFKSNNALIWGLHIFLMQQKSSNGGGSCEREGTWCENSEGVS